VAAVGLAAHNPAQAVAVVAVRSCGKAAVELAAHSQAQAAVRSKGRGVARRVPLAVRHHEQLLPLEVRHHERRKGLAARRCHEHGKRPRASLPSTQRQPATSVRRPCRRTGSDLHHHRRRSLHHHLHRALDLHKKERQRTLPLRLDRLTLQERQRS